MCREPDYLSWLLTMPDSGSVTGRIYHVQSCVFDATLYCDSEDIHNSQHNQQPNTHYYPQGRMGYMCAFVTVPTNMSGFVFPLNPPKRGVRKKTYTRINPRKVMNTGFLAFLWRPLVKCFMALTLQASRGWIGRVPGRILEIR